MPKKAAAATSKKRATTAKKKTSAKKAKTKRAKATKTAKKKATRKRAAKAPSAGATRLRVRQVRSGLGHAATYRRTLEALGLRHHQDEVVVADNPSMRGMLHKVRHLVRVTAEEA
ncbi:MAG: 50S ribosomal protein L30 [Gemmatimonadales bacterium]|jgi:large subunit ribosomal protein L30